MERRSAPAAAKAAFIVGGTHAAVSVYWALGGTWLVSTVSRSLTDPAYSRRADVVLALWGAIALKIVAAVLPILATRRPGFRAPWQRRLRIVSWLEALILTLYGLVLTVAGLLVQAGIVHTARDADHRALAWHAYLWDPWFLAWGLLVLVALWRTRPAIVKAPATLRPRAALDRRSVPPDGPRHRAADINSRGASSASVGR